ncbi:hypothetical protein EJB05_43347, partial [Eragrostis curvula]
MRSTTTTFFLLALTVLLSTPFADASPQEEQLRKFMASRALNRLANRHTADVTYNPWADPASSFAHLPERCKVPPSGSKEADRIERLPGQPPRVNFAQYSGYNVFVQRTSSTCLHGTELITYGGVRAVANVIFLESPVGVGFSFTRNVTSVGDRTTAEDAYVFLVKWLERFTEYKGRDFYIAGESYGGHYVPELATVITFMNHFPGQQTQINLRGIFVGNPYLDYFLNNKGNFEFMWSHGVISDEGWERILAHCNFNGSDDLSCWEPQLWFEKGNIYPYNIYAPLPGYDPCIDNHVSTYLNNQEVQKALHARINTNWSLCKLASCHPKERPMGSWGPRFKPLASHPILYQECSQWGVEPRIARSHSNLSCIYLFVSFSHGMPLAWSHDGLPVSMVPIIKSLVDRGLRVWIYRYKTVQILASLCGRFLMWNCTPWMQVGGYVQQYQGGFTLASVRGAGHMVPSFQPKRSLVLLYSFLKNMLPPAGDPN